MLSVKKTQNENSIFSSELLVWKTINASATQTYKKKGLKTRDRVDRVKLTASIYPYVSTF